MSGFFKMSGRGEGWGDGRDVTEAHPFLRPPNRLQPANNPSSAVMPKQRLQCSVDVLLKSIDSCGTG